jgi:hypothetical protein
MIGRILLAGLLTTGASVLGGCAKAQQYQHWLSLSATELRAEISTPAEAAELLDLVLDPSTDRRPEGKDDWRSLAHILEHREGDCDDYVLASAALLSDNGYSDKMLVVGYIRWFVTQEGDLRRRGHCHAVHLLEKDGLYGASGQIYWDRKPPQCQSIEDLVRALPLNYGRWEFYKVIPLAEVDYVEGRGNLFEQLVQTWKDTKWIDVEYPTTSSQPVRRSTVTDEWEP